jgi:hypothetical protein
MAHYQVDAKNREKESLGGIFKVIFCTFGTKMVEFAIVKPTWQDFPLGWNYTNLPGDMVRPEEQSYTL